MYAASRDSMIDTDPTRSTFNPKAVTMASRMPPPPPKKKQEGPYIDFNKHPDSYLILPYGNTHAKEMSPKTKVFIDIARWIQFSLKILTLLGAIGIMLCGIFIRGAQDTEGYILRIPVCTTQSTFKTSLTQTARCGPHRLSIRDIPSSP